MPARPRKKTPTRRPKLKPGKKGALIRFSATQKITFRRIPRGDDPDGGTWLKIGEPTWWKSNPKERVSRVIKMTALKAYRKLTKR